MPCVPAVQALLVALVPLLSSFVPGEQLDVRAVSQAISVRVHKAVFHR